MIAMRSRLVQALVAGSVFMAASMAQSTDSTGCGATVDPKLKGSALSEKLAKCNGVLKPSGAADGDIIIPVPKIDDPSVVHPKDLHRDKGVAK
jgi:hypothetical protein